MKQVTPKLTGTSPVRNVHIPANRSGKINKPLFTVFAIIYEDDRK